MHEGTVLRPSLTVVLHDLLLDLGLTSGWFLAMYFFLRQTGAVPTTSFPWWVVTLLGVVLFIAGARVGTARKVMEASITLEEGGLAVEGRRGRSRVRFDSIERARETDPGHGLPTLWTFHPRGAPAVTVSTLGLDRRVREDLRAFLVERLGPRVG